jgi:hypothetical protein
MRERTKQRLRAINEAPLRAFERIGDWVHRNEPDVPEVEERGTGAAAAIGAVFAILTAAAVAFLVHPLLGLAAFFMIAGLTRDD